VKAVVEMVRVFGLDFVSIESSAAVYPGCHRFYLQAGVSSTLIERDLVSAASFNRALTVSVSVWADSFLFASPGHDRSAELGSRRGHLDRTSHLREYITPKHGRMSRWPDGLRSAPTNCAPSWPAAVELGAKARIRHEWFRRPPADAADCSVAELSPNITGRRLVAYPFFRAEKTAAGGVYGGAPHPQRSAFCRACRDRVS